MNFGLRGHDIQSDSIENLAVKCRELGLTSVQLVLKKTIKDFKEGMFSPSYAMNIGKTFAKNNIEIAVLGCYINPSNTDEIKLKKDMNYFIECLKYARFMNAGMVGLETGFIGSECIPQKNHTDEAYQILLSNMKTLCNAAEKLGVMIGIEGVSSFVINTPEKMRKLIDDLNSPNVCVILDILNYLTIENHHKQEDVILKSFDILKNEIGAIHLKDFIIKNDEIHYIYPTNGNMNIRLILSLAKKYKPGIPIILEEVKGDDVKKVIHDIKAVI